MKHSAPSAELRFDVSAALSQGGRDYQEDAIATDFVQGGTVGFAVLSDGMGGHAAGDIASKIVVTEVFSELKFQSSDPDGFRSGLHDILRDAVLSANDCLKAHTRTNPKTAGMGATVVVPVFMDRALYWISVGDSPLYLFRDGKLEQLNEDHSLGPQIDFMVQSGLIDEELGRDHPDRNCLTSVLIGKQIEQIDCPEEPLTLHHNDIILAASDGLQTLSDEEICDLLAQVQDQPGHLISTAFMNELEAIGDPTQDNVTVCVIKVADAVLNTSRIPTRPVRKRTAEIVKMPPHPKLEEEQMAKLAEAIGKAET